MTLPVEIAGGGAVTPAGLTARQTCAAVRAGIAGFTLELLSDPLGVEQIMARVPSHRSLRDTPRRWLVNLAARALREALAGAEAVPRALFLVPPERARDHPAHEDGPPEDLLADVAAAAGLRPNPASRVIDGGDAAALGSLLFAAEALARGEAAEVVLVAVDSRLAPGEIARLRAAGRLLNDDTSQGMIPGEGAVALRIVPRGTGGAGATVVLGLATTREPDAVAGPRFSQGRALVQATRAALGGDGSLEPQVEFVVSNANGERYAHWEWTIAHARGFRTRRETFPLVLPAMSTGDLGAASGALSLLVLHDAFRRGHAPGRVALVEAASDGGLRSAALVARAD